MAAPFTPRLPPSGTSIGTQCPTAASDAAALAALAAAWLPAASSLNWATTSDACTGPWDGIACDLNGAVTAIALPGRGLRGPIPPQLGGLGVQG